MSEELHDFYYSEYTANYNNGHCHTVNGVRFTESVRQGKKPANKSALLVVSGVPHNSNTVVYNKELIKLYRSRNLYSGTHKQGLIVQIKEA